jgi:hypothetical protein
MPNQLIRSLRQELDHVEQEMKACIAEMSAGIDYDYNQDLYDELAGKRDSIRLNLEATQNFYDHARIVEAMDE